VTDILTDPARLLALVLMGTLIVASAMVMGYRAARMLGWDGGYGAICGLSVGVGGMIVFILSPA